jgi:hypothetical protein
MAGDMDSKTVVPKVKATNRWQAQQLLLTLSHAFTSLFSIFIQIN